MDENYAQSRNSKILTTMSLGDVVAGTGNLYFDCPPICYKETFMDKDEVMYFKSVEKKSSPRIP